MYHQFNPSIQLFPALAAEHGMISLIEGVDFVKDMPTDKYVVISPLDVSIFATSLLGSLYYRLGLHQSLQRIVYVRSDASLAVGTMVLPQAQGVSQVLGKTISYADRQDLIQYRTHHNGEVRQEDSYFASNEFWYAHSHYQTFLEQNVEVLPVVVSSHSDDIACAADYLLNLAGPECVVIIADDIRFSMERGSSHSLHSIAILDQELHFWFAVFCVYCDHSGLLPLIMRVELLFKTSDEISSTSEDRIYQGILLA